MICLHDISVKYEEVILNKFSLDIKEKTIYIVYGESGIGKSTLLSIIGCNKQDYRGNVMYDGIERNKKNQLRKWRRNNVGYLDQDVRLIDSINVFDNIMLPLMLLSKKGMTKEKTDKIEELLRYFELINYKEKHPSKLSGGEKRRVEIIRTIINNPKYIILDEPSNGMDEANVIKMCNLLNTLNDNSSIVISTHDKRIRKYIKGEEVLLKG